MIRARYTFPRRFLWGTATSAHQVEGDNRNSDWWEWEQGGRVRSGEASGRACEWWDGRWKEDFDRAASTGQNAHRLSLEWSRIQPAPQAWDEGALATYRDIVRGALDRGLIPVVTLHHFTLPIWMTERGGWGNPESAAWFAAYARKAAQALQGFVGLWVTINEPNVVAVLGHLQGVHPPGERSWSRTAAVLSSLAAAHAAAYRELHQVDPASQVGLAHHYRGMWPARPRRPLDRWVAGLRHRLFNDLIPRTLRDGWFRFPGRRRFLETVRGTQDFLGLNYYTVERVAFDPRATRSLFSRSGWDPGADLSESQTIASVPAGMAEALRWGRSFGLPMYVLENGVDDSGDRLRPRYLCLHLREVWKAANASWRLRGYFHWTLVDNFEWSAGWSQRFGLWGLDPLSQQRRKRPSADLYGEICRQNALSSDTVGRFAPEALAVVFPNDDAHQADFRRA
jgi:beta-glucosidase